MIFLELGKMRDYSKEAEKIFETVQLIQKWIHRYFHMSSGLKEGMKIGHELTMPQFHMLVTIRENEPINLKELSDKLGVSASSASLMLDKLVDMGLAVREQSEEDRREIQIRLSPLAEGILEYHKKQILRGISALLESLDDETVKQWIEIYQKIREHLKKQSFGK